MTALASSCATARQESRVPRVIPLRALARALSRDPLQTLVDIARPGDPLVRLRVPGQTVYLINDPIAIEEVLTATDTGLVKRVGKGAAPLGDDRVPLGRLLGRGMTACPVDMRQYDRMAARPLLNRDKVRDYTCEFVRVAEECSRAWREEAVRDVHTDMSSMSLSALVRSLFDIDLSEQELLRVLKAMSTSLKVGWRVLIPGGGVLDRLPLPATRRWTAARAELNDLVDRMVDERLGTVSANEPDHGSGGGDLISHHLRACPSSADHSDKVRFIREQALAVLFAGHESMASTLTWAMYLLAEHPQARERMHAELDGTLGGALPNADSLDRLTFTRAVLTETLRLYPPAWLLFRLLAHDREVCGHTLRAGAILLISPWLVHRDARWWPAPDEFRPDRWLPAEKARAPHPAHAGMAHTYFPFGRAPVQCPGRSFAEAEAIAELASICSRWTLTPVPPVQARPRAAMTLRPPVGLLMKAVPRN